MASTYLPSRGRVGEISIGGSPWERGQTLGVTLQNEIRGFLNEIRSRMKMNESDTSHPPALAGFLGESARLIDNFLPEIALEIQGLAQGAGISENDAWLLQLWREAQVLVDPRAYPECSLMCESWQGRPVLAQTIDLQGPMASHAIVVRIEADGSPEILMFTFAGLLGYIGLNSAGIALGINMVVSDGWRPGIPPYLLVRHLLTQSSMARVISEIERLPRASSRCLTVCDGQSSAQFEMTPYTMRLLPGDNLTHTNHFVHPDLVPLDRSHVMLRRDSKARLNLLNELLQSSKAAGPQAECATALAEAERIFSLLSHHGQKASLCVHGRGGDGFETAAAVMMAPYTGQLFLRLGTPCRSTTQVHQLGGHGHA